MAGIYFHIPFCRQKCRYCDFYSVASESLKAPLLDTLHRELRARNGECRESVRTLYFGGGTPTVCSPVELQGLIDTVRECYPVAAFGEITVEANPDDLTDRYLSALRETEIDRLSIGIQSFQDDHLKLFNRRHTGQQASDAVRRAKAHGFRNITGDLIYGIPGMTEREWEENLRLFFALELPHLSAYHLTIEPRTVWGKWAQQGKIGPVSEETSERQYALLERLASEAGYEHYEISSFARPGHQSIHNSNYWNGTPYIGIGPAAHSFDGSVRRWNTADNRQYLDRFAEGRYYEIEHLSPTDSFNELLMTGLRTSKGVPWRKISELFGETKTSSLRQSAQKYLDSGLLVDDGQSLFIPTVHFLRSDEVIADLFEV